MAYDPEIRFPTAFVTNEFLRLEGAKFSTSRGHAIWGRELLAKMPADAARFYLAWAGPEREQTNFTLPEMEATVERELVAGWQGWLRDLGRRLDEIYGGVAPGSGAWSDDHQQFFGLLGRAIADVGACYEAESFSPARALRRLSELVREARRFAVSEGHWARLPNGVEELRNGLGLELAAARTLTLLAAPILPDLSRRLWQALGYPAPAGPLPWEEAPEFVPHGNRVALADFQAVEPVAAGSEVAVA
jgi:methionyl-tRNA synthetase